jgi:hypothetical protein
MLFTALPHKHAVAFLRLNCVNSPSNQLCFNEMNLKKSTQMKKLLILTAALAVSLPVFAQLTPYYIAGDFNGWNAAGNVMTQISPGLWQAQIFMTAGRHEFKVTEGDWNWNYPGPNSWIYATLGDGIYNITYDVNTYADGWSTTSQRIGESADPGSWTAVGDFQAAVWNNADAATAMTALGGGIYEYTLTTVGSWNWKPCVTGSWDSISWDNRSVGTANWAFTINAGEEAKLYVNALAGTAKVEIVTVPEPSTMVLCALSGLAMLVVARRRK